MTSSTRKRFKRSNKSNKSKKSRKSRAKKRSKKRITRRTRIKKGGMDDEQPTMKIDEIQGHRIRLMNTINSVLDYKFTMDLKVVNVRAILNSLGTPANRKAVLNTNSDGSQLPLHAAALRGNGEMVRLLLDKGADANVRNISNETPLHYAARYGPSFTSGNARILVEEGGADIDAEDLDGKKPLDIARDEENSSVERYLEELLKEREGRGLKGRFRRMIDNQRFESRFSSRSGRTYTEEKDDEKKDGNELSGYTPHPPPRRGGKRKTKKRSKKSKTSKSI